MDKTTLEALEYPSVLKELSGFCATPIGKEKAEALAPSSDAPLIEELFAEYREASAVLAFYGSFPIGGVTDLRPLLARHLPHGAHFLAVDILRVREVLSASVHLRALLKPPFAQNHPKIYSIISGISDESALLKEIDRVVDDKGEIKDNASPELKRLRREIRSVKERARGILDSFLRDKKSKELLQDDIVTIRDDRFVLLVKASSHTAFDGIIHGESGSGATYFIEPMPLVEINNRLAIARKQEKEEEIRILKELTRQIAERSGEILTALEVIARLDLIQAKARFGTVINASAPAVKKDGEVRLKNARHPLLVLKNRENPNSVTPVDLIIGPPCRVLVISGANTGGKTVALKTFGLLTLMAMSGLPVSADEGSEAVAFSAIFADIGDRQDIIASLSTFSAHVKRLKEFFGLAGGGSLVLIDEIGAGTDPSEGSALALAALETLKEKGAVSVVTTHHNLLKAHAQTDGSYLNASVEFDEATLKPLYRLHYGVPGPSLGLMIAESLGIPHPVIERSRAFLTGKEGAFIESARRLEQEKEEAVKARCRLEAIEAKRAEAVERLTSGRAEILKRAREKADKMIDEARRELKGAIEALKAEKALSSGGRDKAAKNISRTASALGRTFGKKAGAYVPCAGDKVTIIDSNARAVVSKVDAAGKRAELTVGGLKVWADWDRLSKRTDQGGQRRDAPSAGKESAEREAARSVNIIGMRAEEALTVVERFIDAAHSAGIEKVDIIHGIGTGALSKAVGDYLKKSRLVKKFYHADAAQGGGGVTVAELI